MHYTSLHKRKSMVLVDQKFSLGKGEGGGVQAAVSY